jgi:Mn-dependent DtxR family transcriptional regulator
VDDVVGKVGIHFIEREIGERDPIKVMSANSVEISVRQKELATRMGLSQSSVYRAITILESKGVVLSQKRGGLVVDLPRLQVYV